MKRLVCSCITRGVQMGSGFQTSFTGFYQKRVRSRHIPANTAGSVHDNSVDVLQLSVTVTSMWTVSSGFYPEDASMALPFQDHRTIELVRLMGHIRRRS